MALADSRTRHPSSTPIPIPIPMKIIVLHHPYRLPDSTYMEFLWCFQFRCFDINNPIQACDQNNSNKHREVTGDVTHLKWHVGGFNVTDTTKCAKRYNSSSSITGIYK